MANRGLEDCFDRMNVNDEDSGPVVPSYLKNKVNYQNLLHFGITADTRFQAPPAKGTLRKGLGSSAQLGYNYPRPTLSKPAVQNTALSAALATNVTIIPPSAQWKNSQMPPRLPTSPLHKVVDRSDVPDKPDFKGKSADRQSESSELSRGSLMAPRDLPKVMHINMFEPGKGLGKGKFGRVFLARLRYDVPVEVQESVEKPFQVVVGKKSEQGAAPKHLVKEKKVYICALKELNLSELEQGRVEVQLRREVEIQSHLRHPNILRLLNYVFSNDRKKIYLVLEFAAQGELYGHLRKAIAAKELKGKPGGFDEPIAAKYIAQMVSALIHLHSKHIIHRDIKPENILVGINGELKLSDFGWSVHAPDNRRQTTCGTLDYLPPEMVAPEEKYYGNKVDLWSLGVLAYELIVGMAPFEDDAIRTQKRIVKVDMKIPSWVSPEARDLIERLLVRVPGKRISLKGIHRHPWILKHCVLEKADEGHIWQQRVVV
ncbi:MAG: spindle assembly checkpoint kinase [Trizodia sp. TS-e1964]|nr:MAG: spindle assembly checkpoint kinase [Trizodia sp. TS-e1964]